MSLKTELTGLPVLPPAFLTSLWGPMVAGVCFYEINKLIVAELMPIV